MEEQLIKDFMNFGKRFVYEDPVIENIQIAGEWVMFTERDSGGHYKDNHQISLFEILAFAYWKIGTADKNT